MSMMACVARRSGGRVGQSGLVCNVDLWIKLLDLVDPVVPTVRQLCVPSHTNIPGTHRADQLAEEGRNSSPLYHVLSFPERPVVSLELLSTPIPQRAPAVPHSLEMNDVIAPSHDTPALHRSTARHTPANEPGTMLPKCLNFQAVPLHISPPPQSPLRTWPPQSVFMTRTKQKTRRKFGTPWDLSP